MVVSRDIATIIAMSAINTMHSVAILLIPDMNVLEVLGKERFESYVISKKIVLTDRRTN